MRCENLPYQKVFVKRCSSILACTHTGMCTQCAEAALLGTDSTNNQSVSQGRQRGLRGSLATLSLTSLERERKMETNWIYIFVFNPLYMHH